MIQLINKLRSKAFVFSIPMVLVLYQCVSCSLSSSGSLPFNEEAFEHMIHERPKHIPSVTLPEDQMLKPGENLNVMFKLPDEQTLDGQLHWSKTYGPDGVVVWPSTGQVTWNIDSRMPADSFHVGLKVSNAAESVHLSFIVHVNKEHIVTVGENGDYENLKEALKAVKNGGTVVVKNGIYTGEENFIGLTQAGAVQHPPSGNAAAYTTVMAEHPGQAVLESGAYIRLHGEWPVSYVSFKGFFVKGGQIAVFGYGADKSESSNRHHHIKFIRNGVQGGLSIEDDGDTKSPFNAFRCDDILFENNYTFGGGRYKFASYQSSNVLWRRNVARYDRGTHHGEPKGTYSVYSTMDALISNNLAIDGDNPDFVNGGELAGEFTTPTTIGNTRAKFHRNMQLNSAFLFGNMDDQISGGGGDSDVQHKDVVSWDVKPYNRYVMTWGSAWFDHMTMGEIETRELAEDFFNGYHQNTRGITNSILHNFKQGDMFYGFSKENGHRTVGRIVDRYGVDTVNITEFTGSLDPSVNSDIYNMSSEPPMYSSENSTGALKYLPRIEPGSNLSGMAKDEGDIGATVLTMLGKSGTLFGEPGYDIETYIPMWPFPMEHIIKEKFSEYRYSGSKYKGHYTNRVVDGVGNINGARGFAVNDQSLTNYVWSYLGNLPPPMNVVATQDSESVLIQWAAHAPISQQGISKYQIWEINIDRETIQSIAEVDSNSFSYRFLVDEVDNDIRYGVTAINNSEESEIAYPSVLYLQ